MVTTRPKRPSPLATRARDARVAAAVATVLDTARAYAGAMRDWNEGGAARVPALRTAYLDAARALEEAER